MINPRDGDFYLATSGDRNLAVDRKHAITVLAVAHRRDAVRAPLSMAKLRSPLVAR